ncbi:hypothetical protein T484DRAFT_2313257 [Baffinella frigidus]|nr:hypothetical protein T484DRAFT_2313257 [Cryptophyta sp. CCMP2293]
MSASEPNAPIQPGAIVELHSLSKVELNGVRAEAGEFDEIKGRRGAALEDGRFLGVKETNMRRVCVDAGAAATALTFADEAQRLLTQADAARGEARQALSTAFVNTVQEALASDPACHAAHFLWGEAFLKRVVVSPASNSNEEVYKSAIQHFRRAAGNGGGVKAHCFISDGLAQLPNGLKNNRVVLDKLVVEYPGSPDIRLKLGINAVQQGELDLAEREMKEAVRLFRSGVPSFDPATQALHVGNALENLCKLAFVRAGDLSANGHHQDAVQVLSGAWTEFGVASYGSNKVQLVGELSRVMTKTGDIEGAVRTAHLCVESARGWREATDRMCSYAVHVLGESHEARADVLQAAGDEAGAAKMFREAEKLFEHAVTVLSGKPYVFSP